MSEKKDVLFIHALTGLHPGSGAALGVVDLPVQRERHTQWPVIPGSAIKGVVRDACREKVAAANGGDRRKANEEHPELVAAFGPGKIGAGDDTHAGAVSFTDARILAYPVRSLKGVFAWVTCPAVLSRLKRDLELVLGGDDNTYKRLMWPTPDKDKAAVSAALQVEGSAVLEEFDFRAVDDDNSKRLVALGEWLSENVGADEHTNQRLKTHTVVLHDDDFTHFVRHATEVVARVGLDYERKTVKDGALFYQEFLPPETLFYSLALASDSRKDGHGAKAADMLGFVAGSLPKVLQVGADETIGKGLCAVRFMNGGK
ncbi:MAG: type III-B CRISPR module RAMP protein Cmr4 [Polyangia bacterium]